MTIFVLLTLIFIITYNIIRFYFVCSRNSGNPMQLRFRSPTANLDLYEAELDLIKEKRTQKYLITMVTVFAFCLCPLMVLRYTVWKLFKWLNTYRKVKYWKLITFVFHGFPHILDFNQYTSKIKIWNNEIYIEWTVHKFCTFYIPSTNQTRSKCVSTLWKLHLIKMQILITTVKVSLFLNNAVCLFYLKLTDLG